MKNYLTLVLLFLAILPSDAKYRVFYKGNQVSNNQIISVRRGQTIKFVARLSTSNTNMDDIDRVPLEAGEWVDSVAIVDSLIVKTLVWQDPITGIDSTGEDYIEFQLDSGGIIVTKVRVEIIEIDPEAALDIYGDQIDFNSTDQSMISSYGLDGLSLEGGLASSSLNADAANFIHVNGGFQSKLDASSLSLGLGIANTARATLHIKQRDGTPSLALVNDGDGNDTYLFDIKSNDLHVLYDFDGPGSDSIPRKITELDGQTGNWMTNSDFRLKKNIQPMKQVVEKIMKLDPKQYLYLQQDDNSPMEIGFIAQEVLSIFPDLVEIGEDGYYQMNYDDFGILAIKAIQEQQQQLESYQKHIHSLEQEVRELKELVRGISTLAKGSVNSEE